MKNNNSPKVAKETSSEAPDVVSPLGESIIICSRCKNPKDISNFNKARLARRDRICLECYRERTREWFNKKKLSPKTIKEKKEILIKREKSRIEYQKRKNIIIINKGSGRQVKKTSDIYHKTSKILYKYIKDGYIIKSKKCFLCGSNKNIQAHHPNYDMPLYIFWVCPTCHCYIHRLIRVKKEINPFNRK